ncbi:CAMK/CAMK1 protein kinase [Cedratvirus A11]|uniref:CAMK/CAMK1 protein kinase n=1 Tax=Cedratvirus A11 TaxID=1903266 RepID=A0A1M7XUU4_9VIRU|nr:CAMK/CAMK1 protein kinase [Cedratvirus A11]SHO33441.1 CAMK/CAMK1 protein kinase [Cedratvirus A11]
MYGGYRVVKELDFGSYGKVYKAEKDGTEYALKEFYKPEDYSGIPSPSEISLLFSFSCPNIVKAIDFFREEDRYYLVMELGQTNMINHICDLIEYSGKVYPASSYCRDVALAVQYMHASGFAHCDIKPANCLLFKEEGDRECIKLADLGFSFLVKSNLTYPITPAFSPPETLHVDIKSILDKRYLSFLSYFTQKKDYYAIDIWSLGVTFAFFLTGRHLFGNTSQQETLSFMISYIRYPVTYLTEFGIPEDWLPLLLGMLKPQARERITIKQVLQDAMLVSSSPSTSFYKLENLSLSPLQQCPLIDQGRDFIYAFFSQNKPEACMSLATINTYYYACSQREDLKQEAKLLAFACLLLFSKVYARYIIDEREFSGEYSSKQIEDMEWQVMSLLKHKIFFSTLATELGEEKAKYYYLFQKEYYLCKE